MTLLPIKLLSVVWAVEIPRMNRLCYMNSTSGYAGLRRFIRVQEHREDRLCLLVRIRVCAPLTRAFCKLPGNEPKRQALGSKASNTFSNLFNCPGR